MQGIFDCETTQVWECTDCGTQFLHPMMSEQEENDYYRNYYESQKARHFESQTLAKIQNDSFQHYNEYKYFYLKLFEDIKDILEIGSGSGGFLKFVCENRKGINLVSVEKSEANINFLKSECDFYKEHQLLLVDSVKEIPEKKFDLIFAHGVFEHLRNPLSFLKSMIDLLRKDGKIVLGVPNKYTPLVHVYNLDEFQKFTYMKQHYYTFSEKSFEVLALKAGAAVAEFEYLQAWGLDNTLSWLRYRKPRNFWQLTKILSQETLRSYKEDMRKNKTTDLIFVTLKKKF